MLVVHKVIGSSPKEFIQRPEKEPRLEERSMVFQRNSTEVDPYELCLIKSTSRWEVGEAAAILFEFAVVRHGHSRECGVLWVRKMVHGADRSVSGIVPMGLSSCLENRLSAALRVSALIHPSPVSVLLALFALALLQVSQLHTVSLKVKLGYTDAIQATTAKF